MRMRVLSFRAHRAHLEPEIDPGKAFDLRLPLEQVAAGYPAIDERRAIKVPLMP